jgi:hypothetical protein
MVMDNYQDCVTKYGNGCYHGTIVMAKYGNHGNVLLLKCVPRMTLPNMVITK